MINIGSIAREPAFSAYGQLCLSHMMCKAQQTSYFPSKHWIFQLTIGGDIPLPLQSSKCFLHYSFGPCHSIIKAVLLSNMVITIIALQNCWTESKSCISYKKRPDICLPHPILKLQLSQRSERRVNKEQISRLINGHLQKRESKTTLDSQPETKLPMLQLPYALGLTDHIRRLCEKLNIHLVCQSNNTLQSILSHPRDSLEPTEHMNAIHKIL